MWKTKDSREHGVGVDVLPNFGLDVGEDLSAELCHESDAAEIAGYARDAIRKVLNFLCGTSAAVALERVAGIVIPEDLVKGGAVELVVGEDVRYRSWREEYEAQVRWTAEDSYRAICRQVDQVLASEPGIGVEEAKRGVKEDRIARGFPTSIWKIEEARRFCKAEGDAGGTGTLKFDNEVLGKYQDKTGRA